MSNKAANVWKSNWSANQLEAEHECNPLELHDDSNGATNSYRARPTGSNIRYSRFGGTANTATTSMEHTPPITTSSDVTPTYQHMLQRAKTNSNTNTSNTQYARNTIDQGLPSFANAILRQHGAYKTASNQDGDHDDDDNNEDVEHSNHHGVYDRDELLNKYDPSIKPHSNLSSIHSNEKFVHNEPRPPVTASHSESDAVSLLTHSKIRNKRFPQSDNCDISEFPNSGKLAHQQSSSSTSSSSTSSPNHSRSAKWTSRRAAELKKNPNQQRVYSSKPIAPNRESAPAHFRSNVQEKSSSHSLHNATTDGVVIESPTTYPNSRFARFSQEQQQLTQQQRQQQEDQQGVVDDIGGERRQRQREEEEEQDDWGQPLMANTNPSTTHSRSHSQSHSPRRKQDNENEYPHYWWYKDPSGQEQGPFEQPQMTQWFYDGYFPQDLPIRCNQDTPFVQLKDWFVQGMTAFLDEIPEKWPQTHEKVVRNPRPQRRHTGGTGHEQHVPAVIDSNNGHEKAVDRHSENDANNTRYRPYPQQQQPQPPPTQHHHAYSHNTPPSSDGEIEEEEEEREEEIARVGHGKYAQMNANVHVRNNAKQKERTFDDDENTTNKSSVRGDGDTVSDSFYEPIQTRMASIHPRPNHVPATLKITAPPSINPVNTENAALNYWVTSSPANDTTIASRDYVNKPGGNDTYFADSTTPTTATAAHQFDNSTLQDNHHRYNDYEPAQYTEPADTVHHLESKLRSHNLTVSALDPSLAATPPSQQKQQVHASYDDAYNPYSEQLYNHQQAQYPATSGIDRSNPYHTHAAVDHNEYDDGNALHDQQEALFRSATDPTSYRPPSSFSKPKTYDPFGHQDFFHGSRQKLVQQQVNKFNANSHTHTMQQGQTHRKYGPTRQPLPHSAIKPDCNISPSELSNTVSVGAEMNMNRVYSNLTRDTSNVSMSSSSSTTPNTKQRERKPPMRHKWPRHDIYANLSHTQYQQMMHANKAESMQSPPQPPNMSSADAVAGGVHTTTNDVEMDMDHRYDDGALELNSNEEPLSIPVSRDHAVETHPTANNNSNVKSALTSSVPPTSQSQQSLPSQCQSQQSAKKRKRRKKSKSKKSDSSEANLSNTASSQNQRQQASQNKNKKNNAWGSTSATGAVTSNLPSFSELQAEDEQEQQQIKRRQLEDLKRRQDEMKLQKPEPQPVHAAVSAANMAAMLKLQQQQEIKANIMSQAVLTNKSNGAKTSNGANRKKKSNVNEAKTNSAAPWAQHVKPQKQPIVTPSSRPLQHTPAQTQPAKKSKAKSTVVASKPGKSQTHSHNKAQSKHSNTNLHAQNNRNIDAVNKVSAELQSWIRTEIKKLNPEVEAVSVAHLLLTLDDETVKNTAYHTFGNTKEVNTFIDSFLVHRSHDIQQQKNKSTSKANAGQSNKRRKNNNNRKSRR